MFRLLGNKIGISPKFDPDKTDSGLLYVPDAAKGRSDQGIVKYIGPEVKDIRVGDYVLFGGYDGTTIQMDDEVIILMDARVIKAKMENPRKEVPGIFFKDKKGWKELADYLYYNLQKMQGTSCEFINEDVLNLIETAIDAGLYPFFPADYEICMDFLSEISREHIPSDLTTKVGKNWMDNHKREAELDVI